MDFIGCQTYNFDIELVLLLAFFLKNVITTTFQSVYFHFTQQSPLILIEKRHRLPAHNYTYRQKKNVNYVGQFREPPQNHFTVASSKFQFNAYMVVLCLCCVLFYFAQFSSSHNNFHTLLSNQQKFVRIVHVCFFSICLMFLFVKYSCTCISEIISISNFEIE